MMNELTNYAVVVGNYNNKETKLESNTVAVILTNNLDIYKSANKFIWTTGNLRFKIVVNNPNSVSVNNITITDILDPELIRLVLDSITINGISGGYNDFTYNEETGLLSIFLNVINPNDSIIIEFAVRKYRREVFRLENYASLSSGEAIALSSNLQSVNKDTAVSNVVIVTALSEVCRCREKFNYSY